ncbi:MAG: MATE family efflux transporter [Bacteroidales bacterium]|nr:MATE family efflux transporter [Bacteroidales bacterium]MBP5676199.1 MATE family efflux transporter [Bacteroidales bacterium]
MAGGNAIPTELGTKPIGPLLRQYAVPGIIAMTASSLYNMVDSIYIGHIPEVGSLSMAGLAVTFPLMNISTAFGTLVGVGAATMISVLLGQKNYKAAEKVLCNDVTLNLITGLVFTLVTLLWMEPILRFFGATEASLPFAKDYMFYIAIGNAVTHLYFGLNAIVRSSGNPKLAMGLTLFTVISNAILDPIFIFVLGLGIRGAALATILCQTMSLCYTMWYFLDQKKFLHLPRSRHIFRVDWRIAKDSLAIGLGPFLMNLASCIVVLFINQQLVKWGGDLALGAYGIVNRVGFLFVMIVMGFNQGMQPIAGYNYGARQFARVKEVYIKTAIWATIVCTAGFLVAELFSMPVASVFTNDPALENIAARGLRILFLVFPIVGFQMVTTNLFQCLGMVKKSIFLSLSRQLLFLLPCIYILPGIMQSEAGVWYSFPISDVIASVITAIFGWNLIVKLKKLKDGDDPSILGGQI